MLATLIHFLALGLLVHLLPNIFMKVVKSTKTGHKILAATFQLGLEGKELSKLSLDILGYVIGPETLVEYQLGLKLRKELLTETNDIKVTVEAFKLALSENISALSEEELKEGLHTPFVSSLILFANFDISKYVTILEKVLVKENSKSTVLNFVVYAILLIIAFVIYPVAIMQPVICLVRKKIGTSEYGKAILKNNFNKGLEGKLTGKAYSLTVDLFVAPSVLDTQRLGLYFNKNFVK